MSSTAGRATPASAAAKADRLPRDPRRRHRRRAHGDLRRHRRARRSHGALAEPRDLRRGRAARGEVAAAAQHARPLRHGATSWPESRIILRFNEAGGGAVSLSRFSHPLQKCAELRTRRAGPCRRDGISRPFHRRARRRGRRSGVQHRDDRLPGDPHRSRRTAGRSSRSPIRTSATPASTPRTRNRGRVYAEGLVVRDVPRLHSNWRSQGDLAVIPARETTSSASPSIDTRKLTRILREKGAQNGCLMAGEVDRREGAWRKRRPFPASPAWTSPRW